MTTISLRLDEALAERLDLEAKKRRVKRSELCREAFENFLNSSRSSKPSLLALSRDLCGSGDSGLGDLSSNSAHMEDFGR
jgi:hypothetical protein